MATSDGESCSAEDRALEEWRAKGDASWCSLNVDAFRAGFRAGQELVDADLRGAVTRGWNAALKSVGKQLEQMKDAAQAQKPPTLKDQIDRDERPGERKMREAGSIYAKGESESDVEYLKRFVHTLEARMHDLERHAHAGELPRAVPDYQSADWGLMVVKRLEALEAFTPERGVAAGSQLGIELSKIRDRLNALEKEADQRHKMAEAQTLSFDQRLSAIEANMRELRGAGVLGRLDVLASWSDSITKTINERGRDYSNRLNALESTAKVHTSCINGQCERIEKLEQQAKAMPRVDDLAKRIDVLEGHHHASRIAELEQWRRECSTAVIPWPADVLKRLDVIEAKLRLLEPIG